MAHDTRNDWLAPDRDDTAPAVHGRTPDAAAESLARALRMSFRLLTVIMAMIVVAFLLTGVQSVKPGETAVVYRFGRIVGAVDSGLCFAWPFPVGRIEIVHTSKRDLQIDDFWMTERPEDIANNVPYSQRKVDSDGLRPGWDGALLTGDGRLVHLRMMCTYSVPPRSAGLYVLAVADEPSDPTDPHRPRRDAASLVRSAICRASIRAGASVTAESMWGRQGDFGRDVARSAQAALDELETGIRIDSVNVTEVLWPLRVLPDFEAAISAGQEARKVIAAAKAEAEQTLIGAAGSEYTMLVDGQFIMNGVRGKAGSPGEDFDLVGKYIRAVDRGETDKAGELMTAIETCLVEKITSGDVRPIIDEARTEKMDMLAGLDARLNRYEQLLPEFRRNPEIIMDRQWAETRDSLLGDAAIEKFYVSPGEGKVVVQLDRDPSAAKQVRRRLLKTPDEDGE
ncbi:MAG: SPFH domain-containing protein [Planctomycetota bacterium]|jgi:membrane protease subunit HflK